ncbi:hypothetical protein NDU88_006893 [Pleurodeles waltl]|uniref:G-protein coupled receptors family 1 profile domain-containing protein n=1 Tax=Pleurodeles waltl TaxID=8319 RepID=A0AAV7LQF8_PLEWA|nr:hypothetical protein NDU88_006893 [Pleurodeles waltl]
MVPLAVTRDSFGNILLLLFHFCLATAIMILNLSVFLAIVLTRSFRKENRFIYMMSTCVSDFCTGASCYYVGLFDVKDDHPRKNDTKFIASNFLGLSYLSILAAQADRYHAVISPIYYPQRMSPRKTLLVIGSLWLYAFAILASQNLTTSANALKIQATGIIIWNLITFCIMIGLNIKLYLVAKYQLEREPATPEREAKQSSLYLIIAVAASFILVWSPIFLRINICNFTPLKCYVTNNLATDPLAILPRINSAVTPILYIRGCTPLRKVLCSKIWRCTCIYSRSHR